MWKRRFSRDDEPENMTEAELLPHLKYLGKNPDALMSRMKAQPGKFSLASHTGLCRFGWFPDGSPVRDAETKSPAKTVNQTAKRLAKKTQPVKKAAPRKGATKAKKK